MGDGDNREFETPHQAKVYSHLKEDPNKTSWTPTWKYRQPTRPRGVTPTTPAGGESEKPINPYKKP